MIYRVVFWAVLSRIPAELAHRLSFGLLRLLLSVPGARGLTRRICRSDDPRLRVRTLGTVFDNPLGLAAGFDKDAVGAAELAALGFGFIEIGTVTARPQSGNPRPRLFRLPADRALINRMGFNNAGAQAAAARLERLRQTRARIDVPVGVNIGKTKLVDEANAIVDYTESARVVAPYADYLVVNVSSPNTPGLRDLQAVSVLRPLLIAIVGVITESAAVGGHAAVPLLVKIAPDLADADIDAVAELVVELGLAGIIVTNTTVRRGGLSSSVADVAAAGAGGLSGAPLKPRSLEVLRRVRAVVAADTAVISVGGVENADDVWERLAAGATLVQSYTGFVYGGPLWPRAVQRALLRRLDQAGIADIEHVYVHFTAGPSSPRT